MKNTGQPMQLFYAVYEEHDAIPDYLLTKHVFPKTHLTSQDVICVDIQVMLSALCESGHYADSAIKQLTNPGVLKSKTVTQK